MPVTFEEPWWLLLALCAVPMAVLGLRWFGAMSRARAWSAVILRSVLISLLACMLAGASAVRTSEKLAVIAVVDVSDSVRTLADLTGGGGAATGSNLEVLRSWLEQAARAGARGPDDLLGVVVFDGSSAAVSLPRGLADGAGAAGGQIAAAFPDFALDYALSEGTNIESALRFAAALFPPDAARRIVLFSDGNETEGDALRAARELSSMPAAAGSSAVGIPVDVVPVAYRLTREVIVEGVDSPPQAPIGAPVSVRVVMTATEETTGTLELLYEGEELDINGSAPGRSRRITLSPGTNVETVQVELDAQTTVHRFRPFFRPDREGADRLTANNTGEAFTVTMGKGRVLVVDGVGAGGVQSSGRVLPTALERAGLQTVVFGPEQMPSDLLGMHAYDLIILEDVAADDLPRSTHSILSDYVSELGGGLVMVGGPDSFGAGGWKSTPLEPILPVNLDLPEQLLVPSAAVVLVLDNSGSMSNRVLGGSRTQQEIANEGAALAVETLDKSDLLSVIAFNSEYQIIVPIGRNTDPKTSAAKVRAIDSGGGTNLYPALERAERELLSPQARDASVKHVIVLSDGRSQPPDFGSFEELAARMRSQGITVSTISIGDGADNVQLARIAAEGGGQFYEVIDPNVLPRVFIKEIRVVRKPLIREATFVPVDLRSGSPMIAGVSTPLPPLGGLVLTQARRDPRVTNVLATPDGEPVLAAWNVGRGQVAAFTSDAHRWARGWIDTPVYSAVWTQIAKSVARPASERASEFSIEPVGDQMVLRLDASERDGAPLNFLSVPAIVYGPDGTKSTVSLVQTAPGVYEARVPASKRGSYFAVATPSLGQTRLSSVIAGASRTVGAEFRAISSNIGKLAQIAEITGGRRMNLADPLSADLFNRERVTAIRAAMPLWRALAFWSLVVFLLDVGTRRVAWDRLLSRELARELREQAASAVRERSERAAAAVASLRRASEQSAAPEPEVSTLGPMVPTEEELEARRSRLRAQMASKLATAASGDADPTSKPPPTPDPARSQAATSGLMAAKRRATERFDQQDGSQPPGGGA